MLLACTLRVKALHQQQGDVILSLHLPPGHVFLTLYQLISAQLYCTDSHTPGISQPSRAGPCSAIGTSSPCPTAQEGRRADPAQIPPHRPVGPAPGAPVAGGAEAELSLSPPHTKGSTATPRGHQPPSAQHHLTRMGAHPEIVCLQ